MNETLAAHDAVLREEIENHPLAIELAAIKNKAGENLSLTVRVQKA